MRRALAIVIGVLTAAAVAACGSDPQPVQRATPASDFSDPAAGIAFTSPAGATVEKGEAPQVVVLRRGESTLVVSRFDRKERLPSSKRQYKRAAKALEREYAKLGVADGSRINGVVSTLVRVAGHDAIGVGVGTILKSGVRRQADHIHFYEYGAEIVIDLASLSKDASRASKTLLNPVLDSLKITKPRD